MHTGSADDATPPASAADDHHRVQAGLGRHAETQKFLRLYLAPGTARSAQGGAQTVAGENNGVPMPKLPGSTDQTPSCDQDPLFNLRVAWAEHDKACEDVPVSPRDGSVSYPICGYPKKTTWNGQAPPSRPTSTSGMPGERLSDATRMSAEAHTARPEPRGCAEATAAATAGAAPAQSTACPIPP